MDRIEIIVGSDGSTDATVCQAQEFSCVKALDFKIKRGRAAVQNDCVEQANGELIVFTDADTVFAKSFLRAAVLPFADARVGCVVGNLVYCDRAAEVANSEGVYWEFEKQIRSWESRLGLLATATGACLAVRRALWKELQITDDCDFTTPIDVVKQGFRVQFAPDAVAVDIPASTLRQELNTRVRQTSKNLIGTLRRWDWRSRPAVGWSLFSHKIMRWFTPFFLSGAFVANLAVWDQRHFYQFSLVTQLAFYSLGVIGLFGIYRSRPIPFLSTISTFCVANLGMAMGILRAFSGRIPAAYAKGGL